MQRETHAAQHDKFKNCNRRNNESITSSNTINQYQRKLLNDLDGKINRVEEKCDSFWQELNINIYVSYKVMYQSDPITHINAWV